MKLNNDLIIAVLTFIGGLIVNLASRTKTKSDVEAQQHKQLIEDAEMYRNRWLDTEKELTRLRAENSNLNKKLEDIEQRWPDAETTASKSKGTNENE